MRKNIYNHLAYIDGNAILYNTLSDEVALLDHTLAEMYNKTNSISLLHPQFYEFLIQKKFIVEDTTDEYKECIERWEQEDNDPSTFTITINPTLDCNMRCWYCYESHAPERTMDKDTMIRIKKLIHTKASDDLLKHLTLSFFGGEPLMKYHDIVQPLIEYTLEQCELNNKTLSLSFVTNGFLLMPKIIDYLAEIKVPVHLQITMDGNRTIHNKTRHLISGFGSYDIILSNLNRVSSLNNVSVTLRLNYTSENIDSFFDLANDLSKSCDDNKSSITIDFQRVWQDCGDSEQLQANLERAKAAFETRDFSVSAEKGMAKYRCYADRNNHIVVNYDGNIFHCTAKDFTNENSEGILHLDGTIEFNEKASLRKSIKWGNSECRKCKAYPLCHGGCSQHKLESAHIYGCIESYSQKQIDDMIDKRIKYLLENSKVCRKQS